MWEPTIIREALDYTSYCCGGEKLFNLCISKFLCYANGLAVETVMLFNWLVNHFGLNTTTSRGYWYSHYNYNSQKINPPIFATSLCWHYCLWLHLHKMAAFGYFSSISGQWEELEIRCPSVYTVCGADFDCAQMMTPNYCGDHITFHRAPPWSQNCALFRKRLSNISTDQTMTIVDFEDLLFL